MKLDSPTAIVRPAQDAAALRRRITDLQEKIDYQEETILGDARAAGKALLDLRPLCPHGTWRKTLEEMRVPFQRAAEYMRVAKCPNSDISGCRNLYQALQVADKLKVADESDTSETLNQYPVTPEDEVSYPSGRQTDFTVPKSPPDPRCERCQRVGLQSCDKCVLDVGNAMSKGWSVQGGWPGFGPASLPATPTDRQAEPSAGSNGSGTKSEPKKTETAPKPPEPPKPPYTKPPPGGFSMHAVTAHAGSLKRHVGNMYVDAGLVDDDGLPVEDEWLSRFIADDRALVERIKRRRKELKGKKE